MKTKIITIHREIAASDEIAEIVGVLRKDGVIVYPTETFYGLGVNGLSKKAIRKVFLLKKRDPFKPISVMISDLSMLQRVASDIPVSSYRLIQNFWPGPLTLVLRASSQLPEELKGEAGTVGVRLTSHGWVRSLVREAGFPITATSANISGETEISDPEKALELFEGVVDLIVDGGKTLGSFPSTVVDLSGEKPRLLREGAIPLSLIEKFLPSLSEIPS
jgi:L-threonylcarbamoyladenylate synthase